MASIVADEITKAITKDHDKKIIGLNRQIHDLKISIEALIVQEYAKSEKALKKKNKKGKGAPTEEEPAGQMLDLFDEACSSASPLTEQEKLERLIKEMQTDLRGKNVNLPLLKAKLSRVSNMWSGVMVEEMRFALASQSARQTGALKHEAVEGVVAPIELEDLREEMLIAAMDGDGAPEMSVAEYRKKPEQPKGISRNVWMEHLKMAKKFAECFSLMCAAHRSGDAANLDWTSAQAALTAVEMWDDKWGENKSTMKTINHIVAYEIICRIDNAEYFNCLFCNVVYFNVNQFLSHIASGTHLKKALSQISSQNNTMCFGFADKFLIQLTTVCDDLHGYYSQLYTTPLIKSGAKVPPPDYESIPTLKYLAEMEKKYGKAINGDLDETKLDDSAYIASKLPGIIERHKSKIGKKLFKELDAYLEKGTNIYCRRCYWKMSNRKSFYRHILNPYHVSMNYMQASHRSQVECALQRLLISHTLSPDGQQLNLLTTSINVHLRGDVC